MDYQIRIATPDDVPSMIQLLPRLANFAVPKVRRAEELWHGDRDMLLRWERRQTPDLHAWVAEQPGVLLGYTVITLREELLNHAPSAHLEILVLDANAEGQGIATALLEHTQHSARALGARSMSLHVFANNRRARSLYEQQGFDGELLRYFKSL